MQVLFRRLGIASFFGLLATVPFVLIEAYYTNGFLLGVPYAVFIFLFVVTTAFAYLVASVMRTRFKTPVREWIVPFAFKLAGTVPLILAWTTMVSDQMPCFLGGRGC